MGNFLEDLPVFDDQPDDARSRAILQFGLGLMQPQNPITGGGPLAAFGNSVQAGLGSLDQDEAKRAAADQQVFQNLITSGKLADSENRTGILGQNADTNLISAEGTVASQEAASKLGVDKLAEASGQFDDEKALRDAKVLLDTETAGWMKRRYTGPPGGPAGTTTTATINQDVIDNWKRVLYDADPVLYTNPDGSINMAMLAVQAYANMKKQDKTAGSDVLGMILDQGEADATSKNISDIQGRVPPPGSVSQLKDPNIISLTTPEDVLKLAPGTQYYWPDGNLYTRQ